MRNKQVAILTFPEIALFELACAVELFALPRPEFEDWYDTKVVTLDDQPLATTANILLNATPVESLETFDMIIIPSWPINKPVSSKLEKILRECYQANKQLISFCSGAFLLAQLNVFHQGKATTHWRYAQAFKAKFPHISFVEDVLYLYDGRLGCSAGSAAGIDLGLEIIRQDYGYQVANQVARRLVVSAHRMGGQSQFVETPVLSVPNHFAKALDWALANLDKAIEIDTLASIANMSRRTFDRKFRSSFNMSAKVWLIKALLEQNNDSIEVIAQASGFDNTVTLRHHFRKSLGISPTQYRAQFVA